MEHTATLVAANAGATALIGLAVSTFAPTLLAAPVIVPVIGTLALGIGINKLYNGLDINDKFKKFNKNVNDYQKERSNMNYIKDGAY